MSLRLYRRKKAGNWRIRGTIHGHRYDESTGVDSRAHAEAILAKRQKEIYDAAVVGVENRITFAEAAEMYLISGGEARFLAPLVEGLGDWRLIDITQREVNDLIAKRYPTTGTQGINRQVFTPLIAVFNHAHKIRMGPAPAFQRPAVRRSGPVRWATDDDIRAILPHCSDRLRGAVLLLTTGGARASEVCRVVESDIDWRGNRITLRQTKNGEPRVIHADVGMMEALLPLRGRAGPLFGLKTRFSLNQALSRACKRAGIEPYTSHEIGRHAFAARLLNMGYTLGDVQELGGWKTLRVVAETYGHLEQSRLDAATKAATRALLHPNDKGDQEVG